MTGHGAAGPALGYLYQVKLALLELLRADERIPGCGISLEIWDDVAWEADASPLELIQAKHTVRSGSVLTDLSAEVWSAVGVWLDAGAPGAVDGPRLCLVSNAVADEASGLSLLRSDSRDVEAAHELLVRAAGRSKAEGTRLVRKRFLDLADADRLTFVGRIRVLDGAPDVSSVDDEVRRLLRWVLPPEGAETFLAAVWGRWWDFAVALLRRGRRSVSPDEWQREVALLRSSLAMQTLLTTVPDLSDEDKRRAQAESGRRTFVRQLQWVGVSSVFLQRCVVDYHRAVVQFEAWAQDDLVGSEDTDRFKRALRSEWELQFGSALSRLPAGATEAAERELGLGLLDTMLNQTMVRLRPNYQDPFVARGMLHELADGREIGWHPRFRDHLAAMLLSAS